ncbi:hypothetical protein Gpo141_00006203 [Globisporangium polare]
MYELGPAHPLPTLDLSLSVKSRFLSRRALNRLNKLVGKRAFIGLSGFVSLVFYFLTIVAPAEPGQICAVIAFVLWTPSVIAPFSLFRYDVVKLFLRTYDFWFATIVNTSTFLVLGFMMGDARFMVFIGACLGIQVNIMIDANLHAVKVWTFLNIVGVLTHSITWLCVSFMIIDKLRVFPIVQYKEHDLPASAFVSSGLATVVALIARNVYRKRNIFGKKANLALIECVSYRANLKFIPVLRSGLLRTSTLPRIHKLDRPEYVKTMRCLKQFAPLDSRCTALQVPVVMQTQAPTWFTKAFRWLGMVSACVSVVSVFYDVYLQPLINPNVRIPVAQVLATALTTVYCGTFALHYQRKLLVALCTSFDFVFLSVQLVAVHLGVCDIFDWGRSCLVALVALIWIQWALCVDAVTPIMKAKLGLERRFVLAVLLALITSSMLLVYFLIFAEDSLDLRDRVVLDSKVFGQRVRFRVLPFFYNCFGTTLILSLRLLWRTALNGDDVLLVLDGTIVYENYLCTPTRRRSRRWGSILRENAKRTSSQGANGATANPGEAAAPEGNDMVQQAWNCKDSDACERPCWQPSKKGIPASAI